jgi:cold-inducible RNA-binding protein
MSIRIYVGNLPYSYREEEVAQLFVPYGEVREVRVITDRDTRQSKGFAFVELASDEAARQAITDLNGVQQGERTLTVSEARPQTERRDRGDYGERRDYRDRDGYR